MKKEIPAKLNAEMALLKRQRKDTKAAWTNAKNADAMNADTSRAWIEFVQRFGKLNFTRKKTQEYHDEEADRVLSGIGGHQTPA